MNIKNIFPIFFLLFFSFLPAQSDQKKEEIYNLIETKNENSYSENIKSFDSALKYALTTDDKDFVSDIYLQKANYSFGNKKYKTALESYIQAHKYSDIKKDPTKYHIIIYGLGITNQQIGNYQESEELLKKCFNYFNSNQTSEDNKKGLAAVLGRITLVNIYKKDLKKAEKYNDIHLLKSVDEKDKNYAIKNKGVLEFYKGNHIESLKLLNQCLPFFKKNEDYYWEMFTLYYIGENYNSMNDYEHAKYYYQKVYDLYKETKITDNLLRDNFTKLNSYYKKEDNKNKQIEVINTLMEFDSINYIINQEISQNYFDGYIKKNLAEEKSSLEREVNSLSNRSIVLLASIIFILIISILLFYSLRKKNKNLSIKIANYIEKIEQEKLTQSNQIPAAFEEDFNDHPLYQELREKLLQFEQSNGFTNPELTLDSLAKDFDTNRTALSKYINTAYNKNFRKYINDLRINYIISKIISDKVYLNFTMEALAAESGFKSRQKFSDAFLDTTGFRPKDFITNTKSKYHSELE